METYQSKAVLHNLYVVQNMSDREIADHFGVSKSLITHWRNKNEIDGKSAAEYASLRPASYRNMHGGYTAWDARTQDEEARVYVHRLLAVAEYGFDAVCGDAEVHHENGIKYDNRPSNVTVKSVEEHRAEHADERRDNKTGKLQ